MRPEVGRALVFMGVELNKEFELYSQGNDKPLKAHYKGVHFSFMQEYLALVVNVPALEEKRRIQLEHSLSSGKLC